MLARPFFLPFSPLPEMDTGGCSFKRSFGRSLARLERATSRRITKNSFHDRELGRPINFFRMPQRARALGSSAKPCVDNDPPAVEYLKFRFSVATVSRKARDPTRSDERRAEDLPGDRRSAGSRWLSICNGQCNSHGTQHEMRKGRSFGSALREHNVMQQRRCMRSADWRIRSLHRALAKQERVVGIRLRQLARPRLTACIMDCADRLSESIAPNIEYTGLPCNAYNADFPHCRAACWIIRERSRLAYRRALIRCSVTTSRYRYTPRCKALHFYSARRSASTDNSCTLCRGALLFADCWRTILEASRCASNAEETTRTDIETGKSIHSCCLLPRHASRLYSGLLRIAPQMVDLDCARWNYQDPYTIDPEEFGLNVIRLDPASSGIRLSSVLFSRSLLCLTTGEFQVSLQIRAILRDRVRAIESDIRLASRKQCSQIRRCYYAPSFRSMNQLIRSARRTGKSSPLSTGECDV